MLSPNAAQGARAEFFSVEHGDRATAHGGAVDADGMSEDGSESTTWSVSADATSQAAQALLDIQSHGWIPVLVVQRLGQTDLAGPIGKES